MVNGRVILVPLAFMAAGISGCLDFGANDSIDDGDSDPNPAASKDETLTVTFSGFFGVPFGNSYTTNLTVEQGVNLTLIFDNRDSNTAVVHDLVMDDFNVSTEQIGAGETAQVVFLVNLPPGEYVYYCSVGNHRDQGMEGTLTVTAPS